MTASLNVLLQRLWLRLEDWAETLYNYLNKNRRGIEHMETVAGIFKERADAERAVAQLRSIGIEDDRINFLTPGTTEAELEATVPTSDTEQPGMGGAMGGAVGGALGVAGGATIGAAAASLFVPGVGPVIAAGLLGAALLGAGGAATGAIAGDAMEDAAVPGLPHDELFIYEDA